MDHRSTWFQARPPSCLVYGRTKDEIAEFVIKSEPMKCKNTKTYCSMDVIHNLRSTGKNNETSVYILKP